MDFFKDLDFVTEADKSFMNDFFQKSHKAFLEKINMTEQEYQEQCVPYLEEASRISEIIKAEKERAEALQSDLAAKTVREERSRGGETIHRGFYCPSLIADIVIGNCKRGSLCKEDHPKAIYTHYFDGDDRHIATKQEDYGIASTEYILHSDNKSLGIMFDEDDQIVTVAECEYDGNGRIIKYIYALCDSTKNAVVQCDKELYTYSGDKVIVDTSSLLRAASPVILTLNKYVFQIEAGYLKSYTLEVFQSEDISHEPLDSRTYQVKIKRKIPQINQS